MVLFAALALAPAAGQPEHVPAFKGVCFTAWSSNAFLSPESDAAVSEMKRDGVDTISINVWQFQKTIYATTIAPDYNSYSATDASVEHVIKLGHSLGMKIVLKPIVDPQDGNWRGQIPPSEAWFASYTKFITHYARMAQKDNVQALSVGCEFNDNQTATQNWRQVVAAVKAIYKGPLTYAANWGSQQQVAWWDTMDYIGIDYYYPVTNQADPTLPQLLAGQAAISKSIDQWRTASYPKKKVLFTEVGYCSCPGTNEQPWAGSWSPGVDLTEQANCYESLLQTYWKQNWWDGAFWWNWNTSASSGGSSDNSYTPQNKPAESVLKRYYLDNGEGRP